MKKTIERSYYAKGKIIKDSEVVNDMQHGIAILSNENEEKYMFATFRFNRNHGVTLKIVRKE